MNEKKERKSLAESHAGRCVHFNGVQNEKCEAGVTYPANFNKIPCFKEGRLKIPEPLPDCEKRHFPTPEETAKFVEDAEKHLEGMIKSLEIVARIKKEHKGKGWSGVEVCPVCGGKLYLSHAAINGHVWGKCETENCLAWME